MAVERVAIRGGKDEGGAAGGGFHREEQRWGGV